MNGIVKSATNICSVVYILVGTFGYIAFCTQEFSGNVLLNFSPSLTSDIMKIGFVVSVAFSFPLVIFPCRASLYSMIYRRVRINKYELNEFFLNIFVFFFRIIQMLQVIYQNQDFDGLQLLLLC